MATKKSVTKKSVTKKSAGKKGGAKKSAPKKSAAGEGPTKKTAAGKSATGKSAVRKGATGKGVGGRSGGKKGAAPLKAAPSKKAVVAPPKKKAGDPADAIRDFAARQAPGRVTEYTTLLCLACIFDVFTRQIGLAPRTAFAEVRRYEPTVEELTTREPSRPFFRGAGEKARCPYCDSAQRWQARLDTYRIEGGKQTDAARRALLKQLPKPGEQFQLVEKKSNERQVFFEWLDALGRKLDFEDDGAWMKGAARAYLERREPKADWAAAFDGARAVRRSQRTEEGFERDGARLFLAPALYSDVLLVQYLVSRSHRHGGRTFEGRLTLPELVRRMRHAGRLDALGLAELDQFDVLERLVEHLTGGDPPVKLYYVVDRRDFLEKVKTVYARYA